MPGLLNVTYRYYPVFVPPWIALHVVILPRNEPEGAHEVSLEQKATEETKLCFLRCLLFKTHFVCTLRFVARKNHYMQRNPRRNKNRIISIRHV